MKSPLVSGITVYDCATSGANFFSAFTACLKACPFTNTLRPLLDNFEGVALMSSMAGGAQQSAQGPSGSTLASDHLAYIAFGDFQFDDSVVKFLNENFGGGIDQRLGDQLNQSTHISRSLSHKFVILKMAMKAAVAGRESVSG
jgi:hypothetical protein